MANSIKWAFQKIGSKTNLKLLNLYFSQNKPDFHLSEEELYRQGKQVFVNTETSTFQFNGKKYVYPGYEIYLFENVVIATDNKTPYINQKIALPFLSTPNYGSKTLHLNLLQLLSYKRSGKQAAQKKGTYILLKNKWSQNYHHWLCEFLPMLSVAQSIDANIRIITDKQLTRFQKDTLGLLGFTDDKIEPEVNIVLEKFAVVKNIRIKDSGWPFSVVNPQALALLRQKILSRITPPNSNEDFEILWISRAADNNRHVLNEDELLKALPRKTKLMHPSKTSINDQVYFASKARLIIGPHGAGLSNIIWAEKATLIEIGPAQEVNNSFKGLVAALHFNYHFFPATTQGFHLLGSRKNLLVDVAKLSELIHKIFSNQ